jgi:hypothetical protein
MTYCIAKYSLLFVAFSAAPASAALSSADHPNFGPKTLIVDAVQGLYWLTPNMTVGLSYLEVQNLLASDFRYAGFRVASLGELEGLYIEGSIPDINNPGYGALYGTEANVAAVRLLQELTQVTYSVTMAGTTLTETAGFVGAPYVSPVNGFMSVYLGNTVIRQNVLTPSGSASFASAYTTWGSLPIGTNAVGVGTWLVSTVPEPTTLLTVLCGLAFVGLRTKRAEASCSVKGVRGLILPR